MTCWTTTPISCANPTTVSDHRTMTPNYQPRLTSNSGQSIFIDTPTFKTNIRGTGHPDQFPDDWEPELFPEDRPKGPLSHVFESAQLFAERLHSDDGE